MSACETKSDGPLMLTCSCSTSAKSRSRRLAAFCAALAITVMCGERRWAMRSALGALHVAAVFGADHDSLAGLDEGGDHGLYAVGQFGGFVGRGGGLAFDHRVSLDNFERHTGRQ